MLLLDVLDALYLLQVEWASTLNRASTPLHERGKRRGEGQYLVFKASARQTLELSAACYEHTLVC